MDKVPYPVDVEAGVSKLELQPFDFRDEMRGFPILVSTCSCYYEQMRVFAADRLSGCFIESRSEDEV